MSGRVALAALSALAVYAGSPVKVRLVTISNIPRSVAQTAYPNNVGSLGHAFIAVETIGSNEPPLVLDPSHIGYALSDQAIYAPAGLWRRSIEKYYLARGSALDDIGHIDEAIAAYQQGIAVDPTDASAHVNLGIAWKSVGRVDDAIAEYRRAVALQPRDVGALTGLCDLLPSKGQLAEAEAACRQALNVDDSYTIAHVNLGLVFMKKQEYGAAAGSFSRAIVLDPTYTNAHIYLIEALTQFSRAIVP